MALFPADVIEFAYLDLSQARSFSCYPQLQSQLVPVRVANFQQFLTSTSMGAGVEINEVAWAVESSEETSAGNRHTVTVGGGTMGVAIGHFNPETAAAFLENGKASREELDHYTAYASTPDDGAMWFVFLDSNTVAFGSRRPLENMIAAHESKQASLSDNAVMLALINGAKSDGIFWGVFGADLARAAIQQLAPEAAKFPGTSSLIDNMSTLQVNVNASSPTNLEIAFKADAGSPAAAVTISQVLAAVVLLRSHAEKDDNPDLSAILDAAQISPGGTQVQISLAPSNDQLLGLIGHDTFVQRP
jgi:hypothetical protein